MSLRLPTSVKRLAITAFRRLPKRARRQLVRLASPNYTVGAVVLLRDRDGRILLLHQPPATEWSLPGGLLDKGEAPVAGASRELREETGVDLPVTALRTCTPNALIYPMAQQVDCVFTCTISARHVTINVDGVEVSSAHWFAVDALPALTPATARLLRTYGIGPGGTDGR